MSKIIQIAVGTRGSGADSELELEMELYALDDGGCVHVWIDCTSDEKRRGGWSGWSELGDLGRSFQRPSKEGDKLTTELRDQLVEFHRAMGQPILDKPQVPDEDRVRLRARLIAEEFFETLRALFPGDEYLADAEEAMDTVVQYGKVSVNLPELADGLADLDYVVEGTRLEFGIDGGPIADEVHRANMAKLAGPKREDGKIMKPPGWKPPDVEGELRRQGWKP